ncbi:hypothetical protein SAMN04487773_0896 [Enterobacter sp. kpr-6]|uniref:hypothetical protein n=1 Tax=Enterobacter sp. kpr-6 TaxID=1761782 RepID=UPI0008E2DCDC|nr:hypothetical protein [Enterobacter sp. kpr-6]SFQ98988.1 hypothetical protein SAMN04487773_0896 [Enterobacter sp. kpr-6]
MDGKNHAFYIDGVADAHIENCLALGGDVGFGIKNIGSLHLSNATYVSHESMGTISSILCGIEASKATPEVKQELTDKFNEVIRTSDKKSAAQKYDSFIASAAEHVTILGGIWSTIVEFRKLFL